MRGRDVVPFVDARHRRRVQSRQESGSPPRRHRRVAETILVIEPDAAGDRDAMSEIVSVMKPFRYVASVSADNPGDLHFSVG